MPLRPPGRRRPQYLTQKALRDGNFTARLSMRSSFAVSTRTVPVFTDQAGISPRRRKTALSLPPFCGGVDAVESPWAVDPPLVNSSSSALWFGARSSRPAMAWGTN